MIIPIVSSICRELFLNVPSDLKEGALALGATRWEMIRGVVFPYARAGIAAALILGLGRAVGEAIAVTQVIGNLTNISFNLFDAGNTLASKIASEYIGFTTELHKSSLIYLAVILLDLLARRQRDRAGDRPPRRAQAAGAHVSEHSLEPSPLTSEHLRRRKAVNRTMEVLATLAALAAVAVLVIVVWAVLKRGLDAIDWDFFTKNPSFVSALGGTEPPPSGIANAIVGSIIIVGCAILMALPVAILAAIYLNELAPPRLRVPLTLALDVLNGVPAIVIGIFVFVLLVEGSGQSGLKASFALAILMLPLVARSTQEVLALIPNSMREASLALGAAKWRTTLSIVLPQAVGGIITGATLATARIAGETAPLLFTSSFVSAVPGVSFNPTGPLPSMPLFIFNASEQADPHIQAQAWGTALVLIAFVLIASTMARYIGLRSRRKLGRKR